MIRTGISHKRMRTDQSVRLGEIWHAGVPPGPVFESTTTVSMFPPAFRAKHLPTVPDEICTGSKPRSVRCLRKSSDKWSEGGT